MHHVSILKIKNEKKKLPEEKRDEKSLVEARAKHFNQYKRAVTGGTPHVCLHRRLYALFATS